MKTADFLMDYSAMEALVTQVKAMQEDFDAMCANLDSLVNSLDGQWQGKAQVEFAASYSKLKPKLKSISAVLSNYSTEIANAASNESALEAFNTKTYGSIGVPSF